MKRIRVVFAVLAVGLLLPIAGLIQRALESVELERERRHQAVAERIFDEMERTLSAWLSREEERPFEHYRFEDGSAGGLEPSPLRASPADPFVLGYFQIDPDGDFRSPHLAGLGPSVAAAWPAASAGRTRASTLRQAPGTTLPLARGEGEDLLRDALDEVAAPEAEEEGPVSSYDSVLRRLNRGVAQRVERGRKVLEEPAAKVYGKRSGEAGEAFGASSLESAPEVSRAPAPKQTGSEPKAERPAELDAPARADTERRVRLALDPMVGRSLPGDRMLLTRTVLVEDRGYRQGLVLDLAKLGTWLREVVLTDGELSAFAEISFETPGSGALSAAAGRAWRYRHRFAEPFDSLSASLALAPLPGGRGSGPVYALSALLLLLATVGLYGLYRMVGVAVEFAERRSNFVAAVTHELKTPLTSIRMYAEMLRDGMVPSSEKRSEYYETISREADRLGRLINNVLEFSRLERGARDMNLQTGALGPVVEEVARTVRPHAEREGFRLEVEVEAGLPDVRFDRDALLQVVFNLFDNALKYARDTTRRSVTLECRRGGDGVRVRVRDHGPGVPARQLSRVFEPFHRGESELTRTTQGTGLGLSLVRGLVERMGGSVSGRNAEGGGFEVLVTLPAAGPSA